LGFDGCLKDADWEVGYGPSCIVQTTDGLRCQEGIVRQRKGLKRMVPRISLLPMHVQECDTVEVDVSLGHLAW